MRRRSHNLCAILKISLNKKLEEFEEKIPEDYSILTKSHFEKPNKIDMVRGNYKRNFYCTFTFAAGRSVPKLYCKNNLCKKIFGTIQNSESDIIPKSWHQPTTSACVLETLGESFLRIQSSMQGCCKPGIHDDLTRAVVL